MQQKDFLLRYFEELGRVVSTLNGLHEKDAFRKAVDVIAEAFTELINIPLVKIEEVSSDEFLKFLEEQELNLGQLNIVAELLFQKAQFEKEEELESDSLENYKKALISLEKVELIEESFSFDRNKRKDFINNQLSE